MDSDPPSFVPPPSSEPPLPGSAAFRSSSAPTTSVAPPPLPPSMAWPIARLLISAVMLLLASQAAANRDPDAKGLLLNAVPCILIALGMAVPPLLLSRYRSLRMFSWLLLIAAFFQLYARRDGLFGASVVRRESVQGRCIATL
ncbi:MAG TPA: hypothetical protein VER12_14690 [Polyangiaceae bacterium]|nr:hypothetical protein [Polyangiaceae bacterium]